MAYFRLTLWLTLLLYDLQHFGAKTTHGQQITLQTLQDFHSLKELKIDESYRLESTNKIIAKRNADSLTSPQLFKFELDDAKEPDEETKKLIQTKARELQLKMQDLEVVNMTVSKRSKRSTQKIIPELIPFLISDAREPDNATKELIRKSRAKELSLLRNKEPTRQNRQKENLDVFPKKEPLRKNRGKPFASISTNKESLRQGRIKSVPLTTESKESIRPERIHSVTLTTESKEPIRKGNVQTVPLTSSSEESLRVNRATKTSDKKRQQSNKNRSRKRTRRYAQFTEPRFIKFELQDVKIPDNENTISVQGLQNPKFGSTLLKQASDDDDDSSVQDSKYRFFIQKAPRKAYYGPYPNRYEQKDIAFRIGKIQKYIARGQGLENINTNIEITIPPAVTAIVSGYPKPQAYGQKICPYGNQGCGAGQMPPSVAPLASVVPLAPPAAQQDEEYSNPVQNSVAENEVIPEQHEQRYYYVYTHQQPLENQKFIPIAKPHESDTEIVQVPVIQQQPVQGSQVGQNQNYFDDGKLTQQNHLINVAYIDPSHGYDKLYPFPGAKNIPVQQTDQAAVVLLDGAKNQEDLQSQSNDQANQLAFLQNNQEFQELSALVEKSPMDQVHGLSYLLAKEMQRKKKSQRPQDQTSPIVFHPKENPSNTDSVVPLANQNENQNQNSENQKDEENRVSPFRPLRQHYPHYNLPAIKVQPIQTIQPAIQPLHNIHPVQPLQPVQTVQSTQQDLQHQANPEASSLRDAKALGLSPNYNGIDNHNYLTQKIYPEGNKDSTLEYASKYSFGYRVRDLHSGNDFSHKQNRDQDGVTRGQYQILMPDGRMQNVVYYADDTGFHADILY